MLTNNTISERKAALTTLKAQVAEEQAQVGRLANYARFAKLAEARAQTVKQIAASRFDWHGALSDLSRVVPVDTSLKSLAATVAPGVAGASAGSGTSSGVRSAISAPAFELTGCTKTQDDVARLMSRLRMINGVTRVTLGSSQKQEASQAATTVSGAGAATGSTGAQGCGPNTPSFDLVVFFQAPPGGVASVTPSTQQPVSTAASTAVKTSQTSTTPTATTAPVSTAAANPAGAP